MVPLFAVVYVTLSARFRRLSYEAQARSGEALAGLEESVAAHGVIKAFGMEARAVAGFSARLRAMLRVALRLVMLGALFEASIGLVVSAGQLLVLGVGGYLAIQGELTIGTLLAFLSLMPSLFSPISSLASIGETVQSASGSLLRIEELLDEPLAVTDKPDAATLAPVSEEIRLDGVTFAYDGEHPVLRDLTLTIPAGAQVALVGPSGSGKSTTVNLLMRFWDPQDGSVRCDGHDLRDVTVASLRTQTGVIFQDIPYIPDCRALQRPQG